MPDDAEPSTERTRAIFDQLRAATHEDAPPPPASDSEVSAAGSDSGSEAPPSSPAALSDPSPSDPSPSDPSPSDPSPSDPSPSDPSPSDPVPAGPAAGGPADPGTPVTSVLGLRSDQLATLTAGLGSASAPGDDRSTDSTLTPPEDPPSVAPAGVDVTESAPPPAARPPRPLPRILAVANQKGGVGKTTTAVNLGASLADLGYRVLVVDLDPQGNASTGLGINIRDLHGSMYEVMLHDLPIEDCVEPTSVRNLFVAPSSLDLAGAEIELVPAFSRELRLRRALEEVRDDYDYVLIDCPPSLGLLTVNGLAAAGEVVVPIQCEYYALEGLGQLLRNVALVQKNLNSSLEVSTIVLVMYDARTKLAGQVVSEVRAHFGDKVARNVIPRTVRLSEAPSFGQPILAFDGSSRGAIAYRELAKEVSGGPPQRVG